LDVIFSPFRINVIERYRLYFTRPDNLVTSDGIKNINRIVTKAAITKGIAFLKMTPIGISGFKAFSYVTIQKV